MEPVKKKKSIYDQNDGVGGVIYILTNKDLKWNTLKIGCSRHSGHKRAKDINRKAVTGVPASYKLQFECKTSDCGLAEKRIFERLKKYRVVTEKKGQEFFRLDLKAAIKAVKEECKKVDIEYSEKEKQLKIAKKIGTRRMADRYAALKELGK